MLPSYAMRAKSGVEGGGEHYQSIESRETPSRRASISGSAHILDRRSSDFYIHMPTSSMATKSPAKVGGLTSPPAAPPPKSPHSARSVGSSSGRGGSRLASAALASVATARMGGSRAGGAAGSYAAGSGSVATGDEQLGPYDALVGVNARMEQLAAAMEVRIQSNEAAAQQLAGELNAVRGKNAELTGEVAALQAKLQHAESEAAALHEQLEQQQGTSSKLADDLRFVDEASVQARETLEAARRDTEATVVRKLAQLEEAIAEEAGQARSEAEATLHGITQLDLKLGERLQTFERRLEHAEGAAREQGSALREQLAATAAASAQARAQDVRELGEAQRHAQQKLTDEMRWLDEEHVRCRAEDQAGVQRAVGALRDEAAARAAELQRNLEQGVISGGADGAGDGQPGALQLLRSTMARVEALSGAVGTLCSHMATMRVKEVASLAEERVGEIEARLTAAQAEGVGALQRQAQQTQDQLAVRLSALEAAVHQEQQSSLKALQAILNGAQQA